FMRPLPVLAAIALAALTIAGCAQCRRAEPATAAAPALSRLAHEPAPTSVRTLRERLVMHDVRLDEAGLLLPAQDVEAPFAEVARLGFRAFASIPDAANGKKPYFAAAMFMPAEGDTFAPHEWL